MHIQQYISGVVVVVLYYYLVQYIYIMFDIIVQYGVLLCYVARPYTVCNVFYYVLLCRAVWMLMIEMNLLNFTKQKRNYDECEPRLLHCIVVSHCWKNLNTDAGIG